jgi:hypothetical protein
MLYISLYLNLIYSLLTCAYYCTTVGHIIKDLAQQRSMRAPQATRHKEGKKSAYCKPKNGASVTLARTITSSFVPSSSKALAIGSRCGHLLSLYTSCDCQLPAMVGL